MPSLMKLSTSIPFYLWKNTFKRWIEYPVSPVSKILVPSLLAFLAVGVLTLFAEVERELENQLEGSSIHHVVTNEFVPRETALGLVGREMDEEAMWAERFGADRVRRLRQPVVSAVWNRTQTVPLLVYSPYDPDFSVTGDEMQLPKVWLLAGDEAMAGQIEQVSVADRASIAEARPMPDWITRDLGFQEAVAVPFQLGESFLQRGYVNLTVARLDSLQSVEEYVSAVTAYYKAEGRQVRVVSALEVLRNLERIKRIQMLSRTLIVVGCGVILALTLGSISWLEYRQEAYLLALLRSFGSPGWLLFAHMFMENLILVVSALALVMVSWAPAYSLLSPQLRSLGVSAIDLPRIATADIGIIILAGVVGVALAMLPVAVGLRKKVGLILQ
jgi:hypothetical protein